MPTLVLAAFTYFVAFAIVIITLHQLCTSGSRRSTSIVRVDKSTCAAPGSDSNCYDARRQTAEKP